MSDSLKKRLGVSPALKAHMALVMMALSDYMNLRKTHGIGHTSKEGRRLREAWDKYEQALQSEQQEAH